MSSKHISMACLNLMITLILTLSLHAATLDAKTAPFPAVYPESVGLTVEAIDRLTREVRSLVDHEEIVGGELVVIKNRRTVLREAFGWKDRESKEPMEIDAVYCVRSMTKPLVGTAIQMLIDEGRLGLQTPVHTILPSFDRPMTRKITVEHLLTHTSGLPLTTFTRSLADYADLDAVATEAAESGLLFEPGSRFEYSDAGSDTLGAIVAAITGGSVETFIQERILDPLGMQDTVTLLAGRPEVQARIPSAYSGGSGAWSRHWSPEDPPIFPLFLTSQSLYSTTMDYAKFLAMWMDDGEVDGRHLLSKEAVERALSPSRPLHLPGTAEGMELYYGQQWMIGMSADGEEPRRVMFGHDGSDGTHAWVWPEQDLIVLFFTQSRGTMSGVQLGNHVATLLVQQRLDDAGPASSEPDDRGQEQYAGLYWDEDVEHAYYVVTPHGDRLEIDRPGGGHMVFKPGTTAERFVHESNPEVWIEFVRADDGSVKEMQTFFGSRIEHDPRHVPQADLPSAAEVVELVRQAHRIDRLPELGVVRMSGKLTFLDRGMRGFVTTTFDPTRGRTDVKIGTSSQSVMVDGNRAWSDTTTTGLDELEGRIRAQEILGRLPVALGSWDHYFEPIEVLKRVEVKGQTLIIVRLVSTENGSTTVFVDEATGLVVRRDDLAQIPGVGIVGVQTLFEDIREVGGMKIPFRTVSKFQHKLIGRVVAEFDRVKTDVKVSRYTFAPRAAR